jgi:predicted membrane-bound spermidine synthase
MIRVQTATKPDLQRSPSVEGDVRAAPAARWLMASLLFFSGTGALILQVTWFREFRLVFGSSTAASAAVLAVFMGGLGAGSAILGRKADRMANPLRFYAVLEASIAVSAATSPFLVDLIRMVYVAAGGQAGLGVAGATAARLVLCLAVLGLPTFLMGGTLPAAARTITGREDNARRGVGLLYATNTLGAVVGAAASTFVLLPWLGDRRVLWLACLLSLSVAVWAFVASRRFVSVGPQNARSPNKPRAARRSKRAGKPVEPDSSPPAPTWFVYGAAGSVGFAFFVMELVWYRMLAPILGGTTYTFGLILAVALAGIGLGGALYPLAFRRLAPSLTAFAATCGLEAACLAAPYALGDRLAVYAAQLQGSSLSFAAAAAGWTVIAAITVLPAALVSGVQFPLLIALCGRADRNVGRQVGMTSAWNTAGAILGSLAGGFGLLPLLTALGTWQVVVALLCVLGLSAMLLVARTERRRGYRVLLPVAPVALAVLLLMATGPTAAWRHGGIGAGRDRAGREGTAKRSANEILDWLHTCRRNLLWEAEGVEASIGLTVADGLSFHINGKSDGNATGDAGTQIMLGLLGAAFHPNPRTALIVGLGTGETAGWLAEVPSIQRVDVVELEPRIIEAARLCAPVNHEVLRHPRVRLIFNDAREVLLSSPQRYDLIASEPSNPYRAGIANLFTREFYLSCRERLTEDGMFVQWVQGYEIDGQTVGTIFATLRSVFGHVEVWQSKGDDMLLVCSRRAPCHRAAGLRDRIGREPFRSALACGWRVADLEGVLSRYVAGREFVDSFAQHDGTSVNTDHHNVIEYGFARTVGKKSTGFSIQQMRQRAADLGDHRPRVMEGDVDWDRVEGHRQLLYATFDGTIVLPAKATAEQKARAVVLERYWQADTRGMVAAWEAAAYEPIFPDEVALLGLGYADLGNDRAIKLIERLRRFRPIEGDAIEAYLRWQQGRSREAAEAVERVFLKLRTDPWCLPHALELCFDVALGTAQADKAVSAGILTALAGPFAVYVSEGDRRLTALKVADCVGPREFADALEVFEPHVPWEQSFLEARCQGYEVVDHPLKKRARKDLAEYRASNTQR